MPLPRSAVPVFEDCWAVLTALSVVNLAPEQQELLRPLTRWLAGRGAAVTGPEFGLAIGDLRRQAAGVLRRVAAYDLVLTPTLAQRRRRWEGCATTPTRPLISRHKKIHAIYVIVECHRQSGHFPAGPSDRR